MENQKREIVMTGDGSATVAMPALGVTYHSHHGAIQESRHIFIEAGLHYILHQQHNPVGISIFEMGFGTGLNALLTAMEAEKSGIPVSYHSIDFYPLSSVEAESLNYGALLGAEPIFKKLHEAEWNREQRISSWFTITKQKVDLRCFSSRQLYNLVYFDAFSPNDQPELWTEAVFQKMRGLLIPGGCLVTYCSKSSVRKAMTDAGFLVKKLPGPKGKREIVRAVLPGSADREGKGVGPF